jgi:hypothetical protein
MEKITGLVGLAALVGGVAFAPSALAQDAPASGSTYWSVGYGFISADDGLGSTADLGAIQGKLGFRANPNLGVEAEAAVGVVDQSYLVGSTQVDVGLDYEVGLFGIAFLPAAPGFDVFARAGVVTEQLSASSGGFSVSGGSQTGGAFGIGAMMGVGGLNFRAEYTRYEFDGGANAFAISLGGKF